MMVYQTRAGQAARVLLCRISWLWPLLWSLFPQPLAAINLSDIRKAVLKINVVSQSPNFAEPWQMLSTRSASGSGFYIGAGRILTNAHVVADASFITIVRDGDDRSIPARTRFIAHDADLAMLEVDDQTIFRDVEPLQLGGLPRLRRPVSTIGYPTGGDQLSVTEGVVSRVGYRRYVHDNYHNHLLVQVDSAINPGNSGGPVLQNGRVVGVAFQSLLSAEATGYIIPTPVIQRFLKDVEDGRYDGHPEDGIEVAEGILENEGVRRYYGLDAKTSGVYVTNVYPYAATYKRLQAGDIITAVDGQKVGMDGFINFQGERVSFRVIYDLRQMGDTVEFTILRAGKRLVVPVKVAPSLPRYSPARVFPEHPSYVVYGGLVFTTLSQNLLLQNYGRDWYYRSPLLLRFLHVNSLFEERFRKARDIIVLVSKLPASVNTFIEMDDDLVLDTVNGRAVESLADLKRSLDENQDPFVVLRFYQRSTPYVIDRREAQAQNEAINKRYGVKPAEWFGP